MILIVITYAEENTVLSALGGLQVGRIIMGRRMQPKRESHKVSQCTNFIK